MSEEQTQGTTLLEFPCAFPLKIMGANHADFAQVILEVVQQHAPDTQSEQLTTRLSSKGNYIGATVVVTATSQEQLDNIYRSLTAHPMVKVVY